MLNTNAPEIYSSDPIHSEHKLEILFFLPIVKTTYNNQYIFILHKNRKVLAGARVS